jgi:anaerobic ribonucleoside-triphosphate reductase activating protein
MKLNVARTLSRSAANGPGERFVVWVQGCPLACPGCWNPDTWSFDRRIVRDVDELAEEILGVEGIAGVTFTGGEPFSQPRALAQLGQRVRRRGLSVFVFTGYDLDELRSNNAQELLAVTDVLVAGRFVMSQRTLDLTWRGSANQQVHFLSDRYNPTCMVDAAGTEVWIDSGGTLTLTGFPDEAMLAAECEGES